MSHTASELSSDGIKRIHTAMSRYITEKKVPGMILAVERFGQPTYFECLGMMDIETQKPLQPDTIFRIASMTKPIVSVAILMLQEAGRLSLDDPLSKYIPEFVDAKVFDKVIDGHIEVKALERPITLYDLMIHTSGLCSNHPEPLLNQLHLQLDEQNLPLVEMVRQLAIIPLAHQPGHGWIYGRSHDVLGYIIERVTDMSLDSALTQMIFAPLKMVDTDFHVPAAKVSRLATLNLIVADTLEIRDQSIDAWPLVRPDKHFSGGGGLVSTASDYLRFARMLLNKGELEGVRLLKPETVETMTTNQLTGSLYPLRFGDWVSQGEGYGLGVGIIVDPTVSEEAGAKGTYGWSGVYSTQFWVDPKTHLIGLFLSQFEPMFYYPIYLEFRSLVYEAIV